MSEIDAEDCHSLDESDHSTEEVEANVTELDAEWLVDSGASSHITGDRHTLASFTPSTSSPSVSTANRAKLSVAGKGTVCLDTNKVKNVL